MNIVNKDVDYKSHFRMCDSLTQQETLPQCPNIATYVQGDSGFTGSVQVVQYLTDDVRVMQRES